MKIIDFPELRQTFEYDCGAKALQSVFVYYGIEVREEIIIKVAKTTKQGTKVIDMERVIKKYGLKYESRQMTIDDIKNYIDKKIPVIILLQAWSDEKIKDWKNIWHSGHYVVAIGYDSKKIYFEDPYTFKRNYLTFKQLNDRWHDLVRRKKYEHHGIAVFGKTPTFDSSQIKPMN